ncbi:MAG: hypothetical protein JNL83_06245 [Myxococcales bacterium]|nr:hypothetical protein [Myxococcales bacterium]
MKRRCVVWVLAFAACGDGGGQKPDAPTGGSDAPPGDVCSASDLDACEYPLQNLTTTQRRVTIMDQSTGRQLPLLARIPALPGPLPVFIWSAGGGFYDNAEDQSAVWGETIARQGYVVIHIGHVPLTLQTGSTICQLAQIPTNECMPPSGDEDSYVVAVGKAYDEKAVLDKLQVLSDGSVSMGGPALDLGKVAVGGWSGGSRGPQILMGARIDTTASAPRFTLEDARVKAVVEMSPAGPTYGGFFDTGTNDSWRTMRGPTLVSTGTNDVKPDKPALTGAIRRIAYTKQPADGTHRLLYSNLPVGRGGHGTFNLGDLDSTDPEVARFSRALRSAVVAFLDANVKGKAEAAAYLTTDNVKILAGDVDWEKH